MSDEKRGHKRLDIDLNVTMNLIDSAGTTKSVKVEVTDLSRSGMGFTTTEELAIGSYFDIVIKTWNGEVIKTVVKIVRGQLVESIKHYGATFIGLSDADQLKIQIYELTSEAEN